MKKYDFKDITFCVFARIDNEERIQNLQAMVEFYRRYGDNVHFIISEDGKQPKVPDIIQLRDADVYTFLYNDSEWRKCEAYNKCIKLAKTNTLVFNDVDVIIHPQQIIDTHTQLQNSPNAGLIYPYNGLFLCTDKELKGKFIESNYDYDILDKKFPAPLAEFDGTIDKRVSKDDEHKTVDQWTDGADHINKVYDGVLVGHTYSTGGCVMGRRDNIIRCNGYNPNFVGWGFEDDEFPVRVSKLGYMVGRSPGKGIPCWHLHHFDGTGSPKETQPHHSDNEKLHYKIRTMDRHELTQYTHSWRM